MTSWLIRCFVRDADRVDDPAVRYAYGRLAGCAGLAANLLLFVGKLLVGLLSGSLGIMGDAFNNLSDAGSSVVTLVGVKLSAAPPDKEHPFGHGRIEYISAMMVALLILLAGFELFTSSIGKIRNPEPVDFHIISLVVLGASILVKLWMALFYRGIGNRIRSTTLKAAATDSRNDVAGTLVVLVSAVVEWQTGWQIDGWVGTAMAVFVMWSGFSVVRETISPLLGQAPDPALVQQIKDTVLAHEGIVGVHDLMIHNYGPGRCVISLHAEVPCGRDLLQSHDLIDLVERELSHQFGAITCIHMDPVDTDNEEVVRLRAVVEAVVQDVDPTFTMHDFRVVFGETHTNLIFDLVVPFTCKPGDVPAITAEIQRRVRVVDPKLCTVITVEHSFS